MTAMLTRRSHMIRCAARAIALMCLASIAACSVGPVRVDKQKPMPMWNAPEGGKDAAPGAAAQDNEYRLGPGDVVKITVYNNPDLATETEISSGGKISFPLIGEVMIGGMTRSQAEKAIAASLSKGKFIPDAHV